MAHTSKSLNFEDKVQFGMWKSLDKEERSYLLVETSDTIILAFSKVFFYLKECIKVVKYVIIKL